MGGITCAEEMDVVRKALIWWGLLQTHRTYFEEHQGEGLREVT